MLGDLDAAASDFGARTGESGTEYCVAALKGRGLLREVLLISREFEKSSAYESRLSSAADKAAFDDDAGDLLLADGDLEGEGDDAALAGEGDKAAVNGEDEALAEEGEAAFPSLGDDDDDAGAAIVTEAAATTSLLTKLSSPTRSNSSSSYSSKSSSKVSWLWVLPGVPGDCGPGEFADGSAASCDCRASPTSTAGWGDATAAAVTASGGVRLSAEDCFVTSFVPTSGSGNDATDSDARDSSGSSKSFSYSTSLLSNAASCLPAAGDEGGPDSLASRASVSTFLPGEASERWGVGGRSLMSALETVAMLTFIDVS